MSTLPDEVRANLESRRNRDVTQEDVAEILRNDDRPFYSVSRIKAQLPQDVKSEPPIRARLGELIELGYVKEEQVGRMHLYWWKHPDSEWPVPPDVEVVPVPDEMTVSEFFDQPAIKRGAWGTGTVVVLSFIIIVGTLIGTVSEGALYQATLLIVGFSFLTSMAAFLVLFSSIYRFFRSDVKLFSR